VSRNSDRRPELRNLLRDLNCPALTCEWTGMAEEA
jgi:hypothetical protein